MNAEEEMLIEYFILGNESPAVFASHAIVDTSSGRVTDAIAPMIDPSTAPVHTDNEIRSLSIHGNGISSNALLRQFIDAGLPESVFIKALDEAKSMGLLDQDGDGKLRLPQVINTRMPPAAPTPAAVAKFMSALTEIEQNAGGAQDAMGILGTTIGDFAWLDQLDFGRCITAQ